MRRSRRPAVRLAIASTDDELVDALRADGREVTALVDNAGSPEPTHATGDRWPVRAVGRFVPPWDFDHIVAVLGAAPQHVATSAMARAVPCHLWIGDDALLGVRLGANLHALETARSVIVDSDEAAALVRGAADRPCPILVVDPQAARSERAAALAAWLDDVDGLNPTTIRHASSPVVSPDP